ncbi:outer membrane porin protein BP0840 [Achromobacter piechaudii ATCC 43553]|uniref:Outer membrane porin protein BP0840 n=1 Tax=Achromobacter piechaudii ATCC 43553 TaxID=742159 RepID=D4X4B6_9BURK|nr:outer membrane porin protein BP0840 [Achromobacter piechaudii ATCC 43553]
MIKEQFVKRSLLLAISAATLSTAAYAESSVTLYGIIDTGIGYAKVDGSYTDPRTGAKSEFDGSRVAMTTGQTAGSRWGLRGKEDLGDGLYATFRLESGYDSANGSSLQNNRLFGREATVGLGSDQWGEFRLGRQYNVASRLMASMYGSGFGGGFSQLNTGGGLGFSAAYFVRYDNLALYESPSMGGFRVSAGYAFNADDRNAAQTGFRTADNTRAITTGISYANGPLMAFFAYDQLNASNKLSSAQTAATPRSFTLGGSYDFEVFKLALAYERATDGWFAGKGLPSSASVGTFRGTPSNTFVDGFSSNSYLIAASVPLGGASSMFGSWQRVDPNNSDLTGGDSTSNTFALGYSYTLSKRTTMYAAATYTNNFAFQNDVKAREAVIGLRHSF